MTIDEHVDERARAAGAALRRWDPDRPSGSPYERIGSAARRRRASRLAVAAAVVVAGTGLGVTLTHDGGRPVETGPATEGGTAPAPGDGKPRTTVSTRPPAGRTTESCRGTLSTEVDYVLHFPLGWHTNRGAAAELGSCSFFGPDPIAVQRDDGFVESVSNSVVSFEPARFAERGPDWETFLAATEARVYPAFDGVERLSVERRSVAGRPALREEFTHPDGRRWVSWYLELDGVPFVVTGTEGHGAGYEDLRMAVDLIATTARTDD